MTNQQKIDLLLNTLWRIVASEPKHSQFAVLVQQEAREAIEIVGEDK